MIRLIGEPAFTTCHFPNVFRVMASKEAIPHRSMTALEVMYCVRRREGDVTKESRERDLRKLIGDEAFLKLVEAFGGSRLFVPQSLERGENIPSIVGHEAAEALVSVYARDYICVPMSRDFRIAYYREQGLSNRQIGLKVGLTESSVNRAVKRLKLPSRRPIGETSEAASKPRLIKYAGCE